MQKSEYGRDSIVILPYLDEEYLWYFLQLPMLLLLLSRERPALRWIRRYLGHGVLSWLRLREVHVLLLRGGQLPPQPRAHALLLPSAPPLPAQGVPFPVEPVQEPPVALVEVTPRP
jgi:hypothetical protein